jgi:hypothetical protein
LSPHFDDVGSHAEDRGIERSVVKLAQCQPIGDDRLPAWVAVWKDVCGVEKLAMAEPTHCTGVSVGVEDAYTKGPLMQSPQRENCHIAASGLRDLIRLG